MSLLRIDDSKTLLCQQETNGMQMCCQCPANKMIKFSYSGIFHTCNYWRTSHHFICSMSPPFKVGQQIQLHAIGGHWENGASMPIWLSSPNISFEVIQVTRKGSNWRVVIGNPNDNRRVTEGVTGAFLVHWLNPNLFCFIWLFIYWLPKLSTFCWLTWSGEHNNEWCQMIKTIHHNLLVKIIHHDLLIDLIRKI